MRVLEDLPSYSPIRLVSRHVQAQQGDEVAAVEARSKDGPAIAQTRHFTQDRPPRGHLSPAEVADRQAETGTGYDFSAASGAQIARVSTAEPSSTVTMRAGISAPTNLLPRGTPRGTSTGARR